MWRAAQCSRKKLEARLYSDQNEANRGDERLNEAEC